MSKEPAPELVSGSGRIDDGAISSSSATTVRALGPDDWPAYKRIRLRALRDSPDAFARTYKEEAVRPDSEWEARMATGLDLRRSRPLVAVAGDRPVGLAWGRIEDASPQMAAIYQMWVDPEYRGRGIGRLLLQHLIAWARENGASAVKLSVTTGDRPARKLYERLGFRAAGTPHPLREGSDLLEQDMRLDL